MKKIVIALFLTSLVASCTQQNPVAVAEETGQATQEAATMTADSATLAVDLDKETPAPQLTKDLCMAAGGDVEVFEIDSEFLDTPLRFRVYTPPCYLENIDETYPVLYMVHGQTFTDDQWDRIGIDESATELIAAGELAPFLIVMPYDRAATQPSVDKFGDAVIEELVPWVDENYRTLAEREMRAVGGLSRGASWAIHFGLTHPELFSAVGGHSPPVFVEDAPRVRGWLDEIDAELMPRFWLDIGERDQRAILDSAIWFEDQLDQRDIEHEWHLFEGDHSEEYWSSHVKMYLRWYAAEW